MKRLVFSIVWLFETLCCFLCMASPMQSAEPVDSLTTDNVFYEWTDEQFNAFHDSVWTALYPQPVIQQSEVIQNTSIINSQTVSSDEDDTNTITSVNLDYTKSVGQIPIKSGVSPTGAKTYEIPIDIYPGMRGFAPSLSLTYNSHQGNSLLGVGWSVSGLHTISRGNKIKYSDDKVESIKLTTDDAFYLNGTRLIKLSSADDYIIYESERGNIKVKAYLYGNITRYFEVFYPDGSKGIFGGLYNTSNNYLYYPLMTLSDIKGNTINYSYNYSGNHYTISKIKYNGATIEFRYNTRSDVMNHYAGGYNVYENRLLAGIDCKFGDKIIGTYNFTYTTNNYMSLLSQIDYTADGESFNPIRFYYDDTEGELKYSSRQIPLFEWYRFSSSNMIRTVRGKFDYISGEDGLIVFPNSNPYWKYYRHSTALRHSENYFYNLYETDKKIFVYTNLSGYSAVTQGALTLGTGFIDVLCADLTGTQEEYIIKINNTVSNSKDRVIFNVYSSSVMSGIVHKYIRTYDFSTVYEDANENLSIQPKFYYTGDFNGDGKSEILAVSVHEPFGDTTKPSMCYLFDLENNKILYQGHVFDYNIEFVGTEQTDSQTAANNSDKLLVFDADGDGKTDICHIDANGVHVYTFTVSGSTISAENISSCSVLNKSGLNYKDVSVCELNGDGLPDLIVTPSNYNSGDNDWIVCNSTGTGFTSASVFESAYNSTDTSIGFMLQDVNSDGLSDIIRYQSNSAAIYVSKDNKADTTKTNIFYAKTGENAKLVPLNISSKNIYTQLIALNDSVVTRISFNRNYAEETLITGMANSLGVVEHNSYRKINAESVEDGFYTKGTGSVYPYVNIQEPLSVLSCVETFMNGSSIEKMDYSYKNAVIHRHGMGFCGFEEINSVDKREKYLTRIFDPYNYGMMVKESTAEYTNTYNYSCTRRSNKTLKITLSSKIVKDLLKGTTTTTLISYDDYENPTYMAVYYPNGITTNTTNKYSNNTTVADGYSLGFLYDQSVITYRSGMESITERMFIPAYSEMLPSVKQYYIDDNLVESNVYLYDGYGNLTSRGVTAYTSTVQHTTTYAYDTYGRLQKETSPLGLSVEYVYNTQGRVSEKKDIRGNSSYYYYDSFGRDTLVVSPEGVKTATVYEWVTDDPGKLYSKTVTETYNPTISTIYDALNREVRSCEIGFDGLALKVDKIYGENGKLEKESLPYKGSSPNQWNIYSYDDYDRLISIQEPTGHNTTYSYSGTAVTTVEDGVSVTRDYDALGNLISVEDQAGTITYNLCADGKPSSIVAPGNVTVSFGYDKYRRRISLDDPSHGLTSYEYDDAGNISQETDARGITTKYEYDTYNRLTKTILAEMTITRSYTEYNELASLVSNYVKQEYFYDTYGRLTEVCESVGNESFLRRLFHYDKNRLLAKSYYSKSGFLTDEIYGYSNGHLVQCVLGDGKLVYSLMAEDDYGQPKNIIYGGYGTKKYEYSAYGVQVRKTVAGQNGIIKDELTNFNFLTKNLDSKVDYVNNLGCGYGYDELNRLSASKFGDVEYDEKGNILSKTGVGTFGYNNDEKPYAVTDVTLTHSVIPLIAQTVEYNTFKRPHSIGEGDYYAMFFYNGNYERVIMDLYKSRSYYKTYYYLGDCYEMEIDSISNVVERLYLCGDYYNAPAVLIKDATGTKIHYIIRDYQGSITHITDEYGTVEQELCYDPWGRLCDPATHVIYEPGSEPELMIGRGYTGHEHLPWFGLINMNARLYDPVLGRFLSPDPFVQASDLSQNYNRYTYAMNNPMRYTDPTGEFWWIVAGAVIGGVTNLIANWDNSDGFLQKFSSFAIGAIAGGISVATCGAGLWATAGIGAATGGAATAVNNIIAQTGTNFSGFSDVDWGQVGGSFIVGGVSGLASAYVGTVVTKSSFTINGINSPLLRSAVTSPLAAGVGHIAGGTTLGLLGGKSLNDSFYDSFSGIGESMGLGLTIGVSITAGTCLMNGIDPFTGKRLKGYELHHFATNKNKTYTPQMKSIADKYGLDLDGDWNKCLLKHKGRHPNLYHEWVLDRMSYISEIPRMNQPLFVQNFRTLVIKPVVKNPQMLRKYYWINK